MAHLIRPRASRPSRRSQKGSSLRPRRLGSEWLERRELMHAGHGAEPFPAGADLHSTLNIIIDGQPITIPTKVGATAANGDLANPHTHEADNRLHMHALNTVEPEHLFKVSDFFDVWRTNAGAAGNNPNANFSSTQLMHLSSDATRQVMMKVNGHFNNEFQNYVMRNEDHIELSMATLSAPTLAELEDLKFNNNSRNQSDPVVAGAPMQVPLDGFDADGDPLTFTVETSNSQLSASVSNNNRSLKISVAHTSSGQPGDESFAGDMIFELFEDRAPRTTARIIELAQSGFFNNVIFHRIIDGFMIQGGDPQGTGTGGSGIDFDDEFNAGLQHTSQGLLSMAKSVDDTNDSQFFITDRPKDGAGGSNPGFARFLDFQHSIFGRLIEGDDIREKISRVATPHTLDPNNSQASDKPFNPVTMTKVEVYRDQQNAVLTLSAPPGTTGTSSVTVTARDAHGNSVPRTFQVDIIADNDGDPRSNNSPFLAPIQAVQVASGQTATVQLSATDVENDTFSFLNHTLLQANFPNDLPRTANFQPIPVNPNLDVTVDINTGLMTITPHAGVYGVQYTFVGVARQPNTPVDIQQVHVLIPPPALTGITLSATSDSGARSTDRITRLNNVGANNRLSFDVTGVYPGAKVTLYDGEIEIGSATATGSTVTVTTNGNSPLASGAHSIKAKMSFRLDPDVDTGTASGYLDVSDALSTTTQITVSPNDFHNPAIAQDANDDGNVEPLDVLVIINYLDAHPTTEAPSDSSFYLDVSNDGIVSALDVLQVINRVNAQSPGGAGLAGQGLVGQGLVGDDAIAQGLAAPRLSAAEVAVHQDQDDRENEDTGAGAAEMTCGLTSPNSRMEMHLAHSFADSLSVSAADRADLDELIELLAMAR